MIYSVGRRVLGVPVTIVYDKRGRPVSITVGKVSGEEANGMFPVQGEEGPNGPEPAITPPSQKARENTVETSL